MGIKFSKSQRKVARTEPKNRKDVKAKSIGVKGTNVFSKTLSKLFPSYIRPEDR